MDNKILRQRMDAKSGKSTEFGLNSFEMHSDSDDYEFVPNAWEVNPFAADEDKDKFGEPWKSNNEGEQARSGRKQKNKKPWESLKRRLNLAYYVVASTWLGRLCVRGCHIIGKGCAKAWRHLYRLYANLRDFRDESATGLLAETTNT
eukprot:m.6385 g.6385  ORF g.6385 m.6385 type:complete len:147 (+) comp3525_c0_seq1:261-701(+)